MAIYRKFVYKTDEEYGLLGLAPTWMRFGNSVMEVAHDILEHFTYNQKVLPVEDEFLALGALLALRIQNGYFPSQDRTEGQLLAGSVGTTLLDMANNEALELPRSIPSRPFNGDDAWVETAIKESVATAFDMLKRESDYSECSRDLLPNKDELAKRMRAWLRKGYRKALLRYKEADLYTVGRSLFKDIDKLSRRIVESQLLTEGDVVLFSVDPRAGKVDFKVNGYSSEAYGF